MSDNSSKFEGVVPNGMVAAMLVTRDSGQWHAYAMLSTKTDIVGDAWTVGIIYGPESRLRLEKFRDPIPFRVTGHGTISVSSQERKLAEVYNHRYACYTTSVSDYHVLIAHKGIYVRLTNELKAEVIRHLLNVNR